MAKTWQDLATMTQEERDLFLTGGYGSEALTRAFRAVQNPADWKAPISAWVTGEQVAITVQAVEFFTATTPTVSLDPRTMLYLIESVGYRAGPAGDH